MDDFAAFLAKAERDFTSVDPSEMGSRRDGISPRGDEENIMGKLEISPNATENRKLHHILF